MIAICFPCRPEDRARLRVLGQRALPAVYEGSVEGSCAECGMAVWISPRLGSLVGARYLCVLCGVRSTAGQEHNLVNLENPTSRVESSEEIDAEFTKES